MLLKKPSMTFSATPSEICGGSCHGTHTNAVTMASVSDLRNHAAVHVQMQYTFCAVKSEPVRPAAGECKIAAELDTALCRCTNTCAVLFRVKRACVGRDLRQFILQKPTVQIDVMRRQIKQHTAAMNSVTLPARHVHPLDRLGEVAEDCTNVSDQTRYQSLSQTLASPVKGLRPTNEGDEICQERDLRPT